MSTPTPVDLTKFGTATQYCFAAGISPPTLYRMLKRRVGPETIRISRNLQLFRMPEPKPESESAQ